MYIHLHIPHIITVFLCSKWGSQSETHQLKFQATSMSMEYAFVSSHEKNCNIMYWGFT